ncbi:methyltransferase [Alcanivorax balearicus MACL04]|uniref:Ribosomal RNA small subunit methyltransferase H n=1 Tax=Alloalcanivorax balearicus MACL04 TaxID=1177182 RepID=A0ABT2QWK2_9GAMM|nr:methyltransferase [Alloalcanivorax balearicus MACL04]
MNNGKQYAHQPVMLEEVLEMWFTRDDGFYVDGTFGRGGHSRALLSLLSPAGRLTGVDRDPQAVATGEQLEAEDARFCIHAGRFDCLPELVSEAGRPIDGLLLDLGVSSPQLDDASRGFSFLRDGPLDMRMDPGSGESVADWLARAEEKDIADVLYRFGEERKSRRIARAIVARRQETPLRTTRQLADLIESVLGKGDPGKHPATRSFQALRIHINRELEALEATLAQTLERRASRRYQLPFFGRPAGEAVYPRPVRHGAAACRWVRKHHSGCGRWARPGGPRRKKCGITHAPAARCCAWRSGWPDGPLAALAVADPGSGVGTGRQLYGARGTPPDR